LILQSVQLPSPWVATDRNLLRLRSVIGRPPIPPLPDGVSFFFLDADAALRP